MNDFSLGVLPFYWRMKSDSNQENVVPDRLPFSFSYVPEMKLIVQKENHETENYLRVVYEQNYNVGYLQDGHALAHSYGNDFIQYIGLMVGGLDKHGCSVTEIGAGGCYILNQLKHHGWDVQAIDPSPIAAEAAVKFGIELVADFYPCSSTSNVSRSSLVIHYDVLEHVRDPANFLREHKNILDNSGTVIFAVPDCTTNLVLGDVSIVLHEHINYFDVESLRNVVLSAGFQVIDIRKSLFGGVLYCCARLSENGDVSQSTGEKFDICKFENFQKKFNEISNQVSEFIKESQVEGNSLGCYIPLRAFPYLAAFPSLEKLRFFDDDPGIHMKFFDGFDVPVENFQDLIQNPTSHMLIVSTSFGLRIKEKIQSMESCRKMKFFLIG